MSIVQQSNPVPEPAAKWWQDVHDTAIQFERLLTPDPTAVDSQSWAAIMANLQQMSANLKHIPYTSTTRPAHDSLLHAIDYLYHCYRELAEANTEESNFYYNSALLQVTTLHQFLVDNSLTKS
jgi:hypothetical protein